MFAKVLYPLPLFIDTPSFSATFEMPFKSPTISSFDAFLLILGFIIYKGFVAIKNFEIGIDKEVAQIEKMGFEKQDKVIGLMMYLGDPDDLDLIEHLLVENKEKCFEMKVIAEENSNAYYECAKLEAVVKEGKIIRIIEEIEVL